MDGNSLFLHVSVDVRADCISFPVRISSYIYGVSLGCLAKLIGDGFLSLEQDELRLKGVEVNPHLSVRKIPIVSYGGQNPCTLHMRADLFYLVGTLNYKNVRHRVFGCLSMIIRSLTVPKKLGNISNERRKIK
jgi:hypothetical protein